MAKQITLPRLFVNTLILAVLSGCAVTGGDQHVEAQGKDAVTIKGTSTDYGYMKWTLFSVYSVNGKIVPLGFISDPDKTKIAPGKSAIVVRARYNDGGNGPFITLVPMNVELLPDTTYEIHGTVTGIKVEVWLTQASTQEKASDSFFANERQSLAPPTVIKFYSK